MNSRELLVVVGPTASGKTELAVQLAERLNGEVVSADSVQVYRRFDVGTGKASPEQRARATHHLIDAVDPLEAMDAARWAEMAERAIAEIEARGRHAIVCGGSFLFVRSLIWGLSAAPPADEAIRERHRARAESEGRAALHADLAQVDPDTALRLAPNDLVRVSRALEVHELSGVPLSLWHARHGFREARRPARFLGVERSGAELDARIEARVAAMLDAGWQDEVRGLLAAGLAGARAMSSVGYRQLADAVRRGSADRPSLTTEIVRATRIFARRQRTWLRDQPVRWLAAGALDGIDLEA